MGKISQYEQGKLASSASYTPIRSPYASVAKQVGEDIGGIFANVGSAIQSQKDKVSALEAQNAFTEYMNQSSLNRENVKAQGASGQDPLKLKDIAINENKKLADKMASGFSDEVAKDLFQKAVAQQNENDVVHMNAWAVKQKTENAVYGWQENLLATATTATEIKDPNEFYKLRKTIEESTTLVKGILSPAAIDTAVKKTQKLADTSYFAARAEADPQALMQELDAGKYTGIITEQQAKGIRKEAETQFVLQAKNAETEHAIGLTSDGYDRARQIIAGQLNRSQLAARAELSGDEEERASIAATLASPLVKVTEEQNKKIFGELVERMGVIGLSTVKKKPSHEMALEYKAIRQQAELHRQAGDISVDQYKAVLAVANSAKAGMDKIAEAGFAKFATSDVGGKKNIWGEVSKNKAEMLIDADDSLLTRTLKKSANTIMQTEKYRSASKVQRSNIMNALVMNTVAAFETRASSSDDFSALEKQYDTDQKRDELYAEIAGFSTKTGGYDVINRSLHEGLEPSKEYSHVYVDKDGTRYPVVFRDAVSQYIKLTPEKAEELNRKG